MAAKSRSATSARAKKTNPSVSRTGFAEGTSNGKLMNVGFIGLGHMGAGMAANVLKAGHRVTVFNRTPAKAEALIAQGATLATTIAEASHGDAVVTMLANDEAVEDVVLRRDGVIANLPSGGLHVSSSTISVALSERLTDAHTRKSQRFVAAPVFGRPDVAAAGRLFIVAGGDAAAIKAAASLLDAIGQRTFVISEMPKAAWRSSAAISSAPRSLKCSAKRWHWSARPASISGRYLEFLTSTPAGFAAPLGQKDIRLLLAAAEDLRVPMPVASLLRDRFLNLLAHGGEGLDWSAIGWLPATDAGTVAFSTL